MNQEQIGKFIAEQRKKKSMTQEQLAEQLGITKNAVSKWERGLGLMDMSLLKPLSELLEVSVNEILSGERIKKEDISKKSEENIIKLTELINLKTMKNGIIGMCFVFILLVIISGYKDVSPAPLTSLICAYNTVTFISRFKIERAKSDLFVGILFLLATILNTLSFIVS